MTKKLLLTICIVISIYLISSCSPNIVNLSKISNYTLTDIDTRNDKFTMEGRMHGPLLIEDFHCRIEDNNMYIKLIIVVPSDSHTTSKFFKYDNILSSEIEKIFIEDDENKIMIWEKSQGYKEFDIENMWKEELSKL